MFRLGLVLLLASPPAPPPWRALSVLLPPRRGKSRRRPRGIHSYCTRRRAALIIRPCSAAASSSRWVPVRREDERRAVDPGVPLAERTLECRNSHLGDGRGRAFPRRRGRLAVRRYCGPPSLVDAAASGLYGRPLLAGERRAGPAPRRFLIRGIERGERGIGILNVHRLGPPQRAQTGLFMICSQRRHRPTPPSTDGAQG